MNITDFYKNMLGANLVNVRTSWGATNPSTNQVFLRVWDDQFETVNGFERILVLRSNWNKKSNGFPERKRHLEAIRNGSEGYGVLCTPKISSSRKRSIANFNRENLLKFGELIDDGTHVYARIIARIPVAHLARRQTAHSTIVQDLKSILRKSEDATTKEALANARIGQGAFRAKVLANWASQCCVTCSTTLDAIRASHIKPWRHSNNDERLDPNNGLPLIATLDALFDAGLITFGPTGELLISRRLDINEKKRLRLAGLQLVQIPNDHTAEYLAYHRKSIFVDH
jgi:putative restriction endonuclease